LFSTLKFRYFSEFELPNRNLYFNFYEYGTNIFGGNYYIFDLYLNLKIKNFKLFAGIDHINYGFSGSNIFYLNGFPVDLRNFRFGVSCDLYN
jgi:hypothetical protein